MPDEPYLEKALNTLADAISRLATGGLAAGRGVRIDSVGGRTVISLEEPDGYADPGRFVVTFDAINQRLYVKDGSVATHNENSPDARVIPAEVVLDGTPLKDRPFFDVSTKQVGVDWHVVVIYNVGTSGTNRVVLKKEDDELDLTGCERALVVAIIKFKTADGGRRAVDTFRQEWASDISRTVDLVSCNNGSGSDDSDDSGDGSDDASDDSGDGSDGSDDTSDDSDDSSSSSSGDGGCCPEVFLYETLISTDSEGFCLGVDGEGMSSRVEFFVTGYVGNYTCPECSGKLWVEFGIYGQLPQKVFLGTNGSNQPFSGFFEAFVTPCSKVTAYAKIRRLFGSSGGTDTCEVGEDCSTFQVINIPGPCPDGECSADDDSSDESSSSSSGEPDIPCIEDARLTGKAVLSSNSGRFTIENHGTCSLFVNRIYSEGSILAWEYTPDPNVTEFEVLPGRGQHFTLQAAEGDPGLISGTTVEIGYHYAGQASQLTKIVF